MVDRDGMDICKMTMTQIDQTLYNDTGRRNETDVRARRWHGVKECMRLSLASVHTARQIGKGANYGDLLRYVMYF